MSEDERPASEEIDEHIARLDDWRGPMFADLREVIREADADVIEEIKWRKPGNPAGVPVWSHNGMICTGEVYRDKVKLTFAKGASLDDPSGLFNSSLEGKTRRAIDFHAGDAVDADALKALVQAAIAVNASSRS